MVTANIAKYLSHWVTYIVLYTGRWVMSQE